MPPEVPSIPLGRCLTPDQLLDFMFCSSLRCLIRLSEHHCSALMGDRGTDCHIIWTFEHLPERGHGSDYSTVRPSDPSRTRPRGQASSLKDLKPCEVPEEMQSDGEKKAWITHRLHGKNEDFKVKGWRGTEAHDWILVDPPRSSSNVHLPVSTSKKEDAKLGQISMLRGWQVVSSDWSGNWRVAGSTSWSAAG